MSGEMSYWLTTHYRHHLKEHPYNIYLKHEHRLRADEVNPGDKVVFYELKGKVSGRQEVIAIGEIAGTIQKNKHRDGGPDIGDQIWEWEIPCTEPDRSGKVNKENVQTILGWSSKANFRIHAGL